MLLLCVCVSICVYILKNAKIESFYRANIKIESFHCACVCICVYILKNVKLIKILLQQIYKLW